MPTLVRVSTSSVIIIFIYFSLLHGHDLSASQVVVNKPVTLACLCSENTAVVEWWITYPPKALIIKCQNGEPKTKDGLHGRFDMLKGDGGNFSMTINPTVFNDAGIYTCTCDHKIHSDVKLTVIAPWDIIVHEGQNVTLPCYGDTRQDAKDGTWKKDGQTICQYIHEDQNSTHDEVSCGRFMLSRKKFLDGDLSLRIASVIQADAGLYQCFFHDESRPGEPPAFLLSVLVKEDDRQSTTPDDCWIRAAVPVSVLILAILGMIIFSVWSRFKKPQLVTPRSRCPVQEETPALPKPSSTQPIMEG